MGVVNTKGLELLNINSGDGFLAEKDFIPKMENIIKIDIKELANNVEKAEFEYLKNGITTVQEGLAKEEEWNVLKYMSENKMLKTDVIAYIDIKKSSNIVENNKKYIRKYVNNLKIGGYKIILDGSPQGKTAWLQEPYEGENEYRGHGIYKDSEVEKYITKAKEENFQILAHCNGDMAARQYINAIKKVKYNKKLRPVMIHAQILNKKELEEMKEENIIPSFFVTHVYYWGDIHIKNLGKRAEKISQVNTAKKLGLKYTFHQDTPVIYPNLLETIFVSTSRTTKNGIKLGEDEIISVYDALKGITINSAYQYFEEDVKGSIKEGKDADLVILDKNPLKINKNDIKNIEVYETIKNGVTVYKVNKTL